MVNSASETHVKTISSTYSTTSKNMVKNKVSNTKSEINSGSRLNFRKQSNVSEDVIHPEIAEQTLRHFDQHSRMRSFHSFEESVNLVLTRLEIVAKKNFNKDRDAVNEVDKFEKDPQILLDISETSIQKILNRMLKEIQQNDTTFSTEAAMAEIFAHSKDGEEPDHTGAQKLTKTLQATCFSLSGGIDYVQSWICVMASLPSLEQPKICIARLKHPSYICHSCQEARWVILVLASSDERPENFDSTSDFSKGTKNALQLATTFATLFADQGFRLNLINVSDKKEFKKVLQNEVEVLRKELSANSSRFLLVKHEEVEEEAWNCRPCYGIVEDLKRRSQYYISDYKDGLIGKRTIKKTVSTSLFLYFACLLPSIALGQLNDDNTGGELGVKKIMYAQTIAGLFFGIFGGQPMVILLTTAPLAIYSKVIYSIAKDMKMTFSAMYACTGLWNSFFLIIYSATNCAHLIKYITRSTEEIFAMFVSIAFAVDAMKDIVSDFQHHYDPCQNTNFTFRVMLNITAENIAYVYDCLPEISVLVLLLSLGTVWLGLFIFSFTRTPFLSSLKREIFGDYALVVAVLTFSFLGSFVFAQVLLPIFRYDENQSVFEFANLSTLSLQAVLICGVLGFTLSLLFFMDQNIAASIIMNPDYKLRKGASFHWDMFLVALINIFMTMSKLPMLHGSLPHTPLHVRAVAEMEDRVDQGQIYPQILHVRENRITPLFSHCLIGISILLLPKPLQYIPSPVLNGVFLYLAITALDGNQMFERITLFFTEQSAYPPNHYIRQVPLKTLYLFTFLQLLQLGLVCLFGFVPVTYMKMGFPLIIMLLLPIRLKILPLAINEEQLNEIDGH